LGADHVDVATSHYKMGLAYTKLGNHDKAQDMFQKEASIRAKK